MSEDVREGQPSDPAVRDLGLVVHRLELQQVSVAVHSGLLVLLEELLGCLLYTSLNAQSATKENVLPVPPMRLMAIDMSAGWNSSGCPAA